MAAPTSEGDEPLIAAINVTPLVDVVLVLLVVLMVTGSYLARRGLPLDPPDANAARATPLDALEVSIDAAGTVAVDGRVVDPAGLRTSVRAYAAAAGRDGRATIAADRSARHGDVVSVIDVVRQEHVDHVALRVREVAR